mmetsp:Transcript_23718/g.43577  ORF Transcript_23718/g.43577 Transcript_23718/m.43577 type:complete len:265 (+) Transcript_23718:1376-2170(+)
MLFPSGGCDWVTVRSVFGLFVPILWLASMDYVVALLETSQASKQNPEHSEWLLIWSPIFVCAWVLQHQALPQRELLHRMEEASSKPNHYSIPLPTDHALSSSPSSSSLALSQHLPLMARPNADFSFVWRPPLAAPRRASLVLPRPPHRLHLRTRSRQSRNQIYLPPHLDPHRTSDTTPRRRIPSPRRRCLPPPPTPMMTRPPLLSVASVIPYRQILHRPRTKWNETKMCHRRPAPCLPVMPCASPPSRGGIVRGRRLSLLVLAW